MGLHTLRLSMKFRHSKRETETHGLSPGNGITPAPLSTEPLATEGEATPGPDDINPYEDQHVDSPRMAYQQPTEKPTQGPDPYFFDDVAEILPSVAGQSEGPDVLDDSGSPSLPFDF